MEVKNNGKKQVVIIAAGKQVINSIDELIKAGISFVIESTLSGSFLEKHITKLKEHGYEINLTYLFLGSKDLCIERIKSRVRQGGHDVPDVDVIGKLIECRLITILFILIMNFMILNK